MLMKVICLKTQKEEVKNSLTVTHRKWLRY